MLMMIWYAYYQEYIILSPTLCWHNWPRPSTHTHTHTHTHTRTHACTHTQTHTHRHAHTQPDTDRHTALKLMIVRHDDDIIAILTTEGLILHPCTDSYYFIFRISPQYKRKEMPGCMRTLMPMVFSISGTVAHKV